LNVKAICPVIYPESNSWYPEVVNTPDNKNGLTSGLNNTTIFTHESVHMVFSVSCPEIGIITSFVSGSRFQVSDWRFQVEGWMFQVTDSCTKEISYIWYST